MTIQYHVTGAERKKLVAAISHELDTPSRYLAAPTFAYQIGDYQVDKEGTLTGPTNLFLIEALLSEHGMIALSVESDDDEPRTDTQAQPESPEETGTAGRLTIEMLSSGFAPDKLENLNKLVQAKAKLIKMALGAAELPIQITETTIKFPWFELEAENASEGIAEACSVFISLLVDTAKRKTRVTAKEKPIEGSPKYAMRCFLLSIGMIGDKYKAARKTLLSKLDGNSAWKNGRPNHADVADEPAENNGQQESEAGHPAKDAD